MSDLGHKAVMGIRTAFGSDAGANIVAHSDRQRIGAALDQWLESLPRSG